MDALRASVKSFLDGSCIITPAIGAVSLGLVGRSAMSVRTGRNFRYSAVGHTLTGALMGVAGAYIAKGAIFVAAAALCIPALIVLSFIRSDEIDYARARNAKSTKQSDAKGSASKQAGGKPAVTATTPNRFARPTPSVRPGVLKAARPQGVLRQFCPAPA
jgi:hypothetical protein